MFNWVSVAPVCLFTAGEFQGAIEAICASDEEMGREIRDTVAHEVEHHFGIDDERLEEMER